MPDFRNRIIDVRQVAASELVPNGKNWRTHPQAQATALRAVLEDIGLIDVVIARQDGDRLVLIDGHLRQELSNPDQLLHVVVTDLTEEEADVALLTHDSLTIMAEANRTAVRKLLDGMGERHTNLAGLLADIRERQHLLVERAFLKDPDDVPETPAEPMTKLGDLWQLGDHRLLCGDAGCEVDHARLLDGASIDLALTDPPYGVGIEYGDATEDSEAFVMELMGRALPLIRRWPVALITSGARLLWRYPEPNWILAWVHPAGMGSGPWGFTCLNPVLAYGADPYLKRQLGRRADALVLAADREEIKGHPVIKPLKVWEWLLERGSPARGESVLDSFAGSGTTLIACERLDRRAFCMEIEPRYVDVAVRRWEEFTGQKAKKLS